MLLEDEGWDLDLLSNKNIISQRLRKLRPYSLRKLRRLRRLRRLRFMSMNLYLHRSINTNKSQAPSDLMLRYANTHKGVVLSGLHCVAPIPVIKVAGYSNVKAIALQHKHSGSISGRIIAPVSGLRSCSADLEFEGRNHSNITKASYKLTQVLSTQQQHSRNSGLRLNNKYLIKHNNNKLKFIVNSIGDNLSRTGHPDSRFESYESFSYPNLPNVDYTQRLDKINISSIFLMPINEPIRLPTIDKLEESNPGIDNKKQAEVLNQTELFKKAKAKAKLI